MPVDFSRRATEAEQMDDADLPIEQYRQVLRDLARVNVVIRSAAPTLAWLEQATRQGPTTILDVGFGQGDMLRAIARWATRRGRRVMLHGADINPRSAALATEQTDPALGIQYHTGDASTIVATWPAPPDLIISSLVTHHMTDGELDGFLRWMDATARVGWFINDLHRHPVAWYGFRLLARVMRVHPVVRHDGALSVRRAFVRADWAHRLAAAGLPLEMVSVRWALPFRWAVGRIRHVARP